MLMGVEAPTSQFPHKLKLRSLDFAFAYDPLFSHRGELSLATAIKRLIEDFASCLVPSLRKIKLMSLLVESIDKQNPSATQYYQLDTWKYHSPLLIC